jgi:putative ABC transport system permease protein
MTVTMVQGNWNDFHTRALERVSAAPGVQQAAFAWGVPLTGNNWPGTVEIEGRPVTSPRDRVPVPQRSVTPGYFSLLGLKLVDGRDFRSSDAGSAPPVVIVNQSFVDRYFAPASALGKKLWFGRRDQPSMEIIGVVNNGRTDDLTREADPEVYFSLWQRGAFSKDLVVRASGDPRSVISAVQKELRAVDPTAAIENIRTLDQIRADSLASRSFAMELLIGFSLVASVLTLVGIYGVLSLSVAARRRDFAIRTAIGAQHRDIRNLVFAEGFRLIAGGIVAGIVAAILLSRVLTSLLFEVQPADPITLAGAALLFAGVALIACWVPTRRAARVNPLEALRCE